MLDFWKILGMSLSECMHASYHIEAHVSHGPPFKHATIDTSD